MICVVSDFWPSTMWVTTEAVVSIAYSAQYDRSEALMMRFIAAYTRAIFAAILQAITSFEQSKRVDQI